MEALVCLKLGDPTATEPGSPESPVEVSKNHPIPPLNSDTAVRVRVTATSLNYLQILGKYQEKPALPFIPGSDYSGIVDAIGSAVTKFRVGDRVCSFADLGSFAQLIVADQSRLILVDSGLQSRVESLMRKSNSEFSVVISQVNGQDYASRSHVFTIGKTRIKLSRGWITKAREIYSTSMQLCGVRDNIKAPTKSLFWQPRKSLTFILTFESEQERNAAIALARKYAFDCNVSLLGPDD